MKKLSGGVAIALFAASTSFATAQAPPIDFTKYAPYTATSNEGDFIIGPPYKNAPELTPNPDVPKGKIFRLVMNSEDSKFFPGIVKGSVLITPYKRNVTVYVPAQYLPGKVAPFFVSQDSMTRGEAPTVLDNMIAAKRVPAMVGIFIDSGGSDSLGSERGLEYDTVSGQYAEFIEAEVIPMVEKECGVILTKDPEGRMTMGGSSGAACAFTMAWFHPELYHRVLSYSGTYVNQQWPPNGASLHGAWEYHATFVPNSKPKPLRIWMHVGEMDLRYKDDISTYHNWVMCNNLMAAALKAKKYHYQYVFARESGHVDGRVVRQTFPQALEWVWRGYKSK